ncbi:threonine/serine exporter ThrE [Corynebacterium crudilactis]|uniref:Amino acid export carrier protein n=1 Tax=Corynebacterium crudilactis TaxID=1652495 RepID=A0A172QXG8_9CORY|nr:threonine/serine exporter family protein [Corynebacterium crudilactis]ANE05405.1 amino acid export carrier protein [Corynebacterium crudilactis]
MLSFATLRGRISTVDAAKAAPPPSPLAPIDLTDHSQVAGVMNLAARVGDILLSSGTSNSDTKVQIRAVTSAYGLYYCHVDITLNTITIFTNIGVERKMPVNVFHVVGKLDTNFSKLSEVDRLIRSIQAGATPPEVAEKILDELEQSPASYGFPVALLGWATMGGAIAVLLGGGWQVSLIAFLTAFTIMSTTAFLGKKGLPTFFQNVVGGLIATIPASVAYAFALQFGLEIKPSQIIASGIVVLLAGLTLVQSLQDGITGAPVTASARFFETLLFTGGIVAGVGLGIQLSGILDIMLPPMEAAAAPNPSSIPARVIAGGIASAAFAMGCYAELSSALIAGLTAFMGSAVYYFFLFYAGPISAAAIASTAVGFTGGLLARRFLIPPLIVAIAGITPLLPGLAIYRGMYAVLNEQTLLGFSNIAVALATAASLAAGVVLGEWIARRLRRPPRFNPYRAFTKANAFSFQEAEQKRNRQKRRSKTGNKK